MKTDILSCVEAIADPTTDQNMFKILPKNSHQNEFLPESSSMHRTEIARKTIATNRKCLQILLVKLKMEINVLSELWLRETWMNEIKNFLKTSNLEWVSPTHVSIGRQIVKWSRNLTKLSTKEPEKIRCNICFSCFFFIVHFFFKIMKIAYIKPIYRKYFSIFWDTCPIKSKKLKKRLDFSLFMYYNSDNYLIIIIMNTIKKLMYTWVWIGATWLMTMKSFAASWTFGIDKASTLKIETESAEGAIQRYTNTAMWFLALLAIMYALYWGFLIMTAGGEDEKVSTGKKILIQWGIGLLVIFLAGSIVKWVIGLMA